MLLIISHCWQWQICGTCPLKFFGHTLNEIKVNFSGLLRWPHFDRSPSENWTESASQNFAHRYSLTTVDFSGIFGFSVLVATQFAYWQRSILWNKHKGDLCGLLDVWKRSWTTNLLVVPVYGCMWGGSTWPALVFVSPVLYSTGTISGKLWFF